MSKVHMSELNFYLSQTIGHTGFGPLLLIEELKQKLQVYIYKCPWSILWIWWCRRIRNKELQRQAGQQLRTGNKRKNKEMDWPAKNWDQMDMWPKQPLNGTHSGSLRQGKTPTHLKAHKDVGNWEERPYMAWSRQNSLLSQSISGEPSVDMGSCC